MLSHRFAPFRHCRGLRRARNLCVSAGKDRHGSGSGAKPAEASKKGSGSGAKPAEAGEKHRHGSGGKPLLLAKPASDKPAADKPAEARNKGSGKK
jgi:hypothetical protein